MTRRSARVLAVLLALSAADRAQAQLRVAVAPIDRAGPALVGQVKAEVCGTFRCVPFRRVATPGGFDLGKARREHVDGILAGAVSDPKGVPVLSLSLYTTASWADVTWRIQLDGRGAIPRARLTALLREIADRLGDARLPARPLPAPVPSPGPEVGSGPVGPGSTLLPVHPVPLPPPPVLPAPRAAAERPPPWASLEAGVLGGRRELRFSGAVPGPLPLRGHLVPRFAGPALRLEVYPAAPLGPGLLAGLGLYGAYATSLRLETGADGVDRPTRLWWLSAGVLWRSVPRGRPRLAVLASASWEARGATVRPAVLGLADTALGGLRAGLGAEIPIGGPASLVLGGGYTRWLSARDLVGGAYFPAGTAFGVDLEAGVGLAIRDWIQLTLAGEYSTTRYALRPHPEDVYRASGATDDQLAGRLSVRFGL